MNRTLKWLAIAVGIAMLATLVSLQWSRVLRGQNDFAALYAGARLVGTPDLYSRSANEAVIRSALGTTMPSVIYTRPPFYAVLLHPLASLPYPLAYGTYCALSLVAVAWFVWRFRRECPSLPYVAAFCFPLASYIVQGQDTPLLLVFTGLFIHFTRKHRDFLAGLVFSLCAIKFHLFLLVPLLLLLKQRWRIFGGAASGTVALFLVGLAGAGTDSIAQYLNTLCNPWINFSAEMMPSLHGLVATLGAGSTIELALTGFVILAFVWICQKSDDFEFLFAVCLLGSLLVSYHSGIADGLLLLLGYILISSSSTVGKPLKIAWAIQLTPVPYSLGVSVGIPLILLTLLVWTVAILARRTGPMPLRVPLAS
ncbi:MAG: glycosyltransferase family 87 protein [Acidobacteriota bacterium]